MFPYLVSLSQRYPAVLGIAVLFIIYVITARIGLSFYAVHGFATLVWPPTGIALAALLLYGRWLWPGVALGAFVVNLSIGAPPFVAMGIALGNTLEAYVAAYLLKEYMGFDITFGRLYDSVAFVIYGALVAPIISATIGTTSLILGGVITFSEQPSTWMAWWMGDMLAVIVLGPLLLVWLSPLPQKVFLGRLIELFAASLLLVVTNVLIFWRPFPELNLFPFLYPIFIPMGWIALRFGIRGKTLAIFVTATMAILALAWGHTLPAISSVQYSLLYLQIFIAMTGAMFLIFGSIVEERKRAMEQLKTHINRTEQALSKLQFEDEAKKEFLALLAHELRNPLAPVVSGLEIIREQPDITPASRSMLSSMRGQVRTMVRLIDDLLDISRISQKKLELQKEVVELGALMKRSARIVEPMMKKQKHVFTLSLPDEPVWFEGDPVRLEQVIVNLLTNATKYTPPEGHIVCTATFEDSTLTISVKDNGIGIEKTMLERVFEPFMQVERGAAQAGGLGVGLTLSRYLTEMHHGTIEAKSEGKGKGSEFVLKLPLIIHAQPSRRHGAGKDEKRRLPATRTVLIVDDNIPAAKSLDKLLTMRGYETRLAYTGEEALAMYEEFYPRAIVLDVGLPDMNGYEVAKKIRGKENSHAHTLIIALTGYGQEEDKQRAYEAGFDHHLTKPVGIADLEALLSVH